jgi:hypothetical protein
VTLLDWRRATANRRRRREADEAAGPCEHARLVERHAGHRRRNDTTRGTAPRDGRPAPWRWNQGGPVLADRPAFGRPLGRRPDARDHDREHDKIWPISSWSGSCRGSRPPDRTGSGGLRLGDRRQNETGQMSANGLTPACSFRCGTGIESRCLAIKARRPFGVSSRSRETCSTMSRRLRTAATGRRDRHCRSHSSPNSEPRHRRA